MTDFIDRNKEILTLLGKESELNYVEANDVKDLHDIIKRRLNLPAQLINENGLKSAVNRPYNIAAYDGEKDIAKLGGALAYGIAKNHVFSDVNKRTAVAALDKFLIINGIDADLNAKTLFTLLDDAIAGNIDEIQFRDTVSEHVNTVLKNESSQAIRPSSLTPPGNGN